MVKQSDLINQPVKQSDASLRFEMRWKEAAEQPELLEAPSVTLDIDLSPAAVLGKLRKVDRAALGIGAEAVEDTLKLLRDRLR
jgi:hypothetical protein